MKTSKTPGPREIEEGHFKPLQIEINGHMNFDRAAKNFRSMVLSDGILALQKEKSRHEKPSEKKRRKRAESISRAFKEEMKMRKIISGEYEKEKQKKQAKKALKIKERTDAKKEIGNGG